jgi:trimeric autotransporter adhesin
MAMLRTIVRTLRPIACTAIAVAVAVPLSAQTSSSLVPSRIVQPVDDSARVSLHGYIHPLASKANDRGAAPDSMPLQRLHLVLQRSSGQEATLRSLIAGMNTSGNANYHKWLTPAQFGQQFGPSDQDVATVESWLSARGFEVTGIKSGKQVIEFNGSVAQLRNAFGVKIHKYVVNGETHYATATEPSIPAAIAPVVSGFVSLNNFRPKKDLHVLGQATWNTKTHQAKPEWTYGTSAPYTYMMSPADFGVEYDLPNTLLNANYAGTTWDGTGQTVAIINDSNINLDLVQQFRSIFLGSSYATNLPTVVIDGNDPGVDGINDPDGPNYDSDEAYIDVEWSGAVAPKANIDMVIAADTDLEGGLFLAFEDAIYSNIAPILSMSFGGCEAGMGSTNLFMDELMEQAAAQGQTVVVSSGDSGSAGCDSDSSPFAVQGVSVSGFASTPWDVAAGGTDLYYSDYASGGASSASDWTQTATQNPQVSLHHYVQEQPWNDSQFGLDTENYYTEFGTTTIAGGSGGASSAALCSGDDYDSTTGLCDSTVSGYPKPSWQTGTGVPTDGVRDIPDVSLFASDGASFSMYPFCYADGDCQISSNPIQISGAGGTSFAAPAFAGIMALVNQKYGTQGQADFVLYPLKAQFPAAFHDVTVGTNAVPCNLIEVTEGGNSFPPTDCLTVTNPIDFPTGTGQTIPEGETGTGSTPDYNAAAGYNLATGLGSVDAATLIADWGKVSFQTTSVTLSSPSAGGSFTHGQAVSVSGSVTGSGSIAGNVALMTNSQEPANAGSGFGTTFAGSPSTYAVSSSGSFSGNISDLPGGTYDVWAQYGGDGTNGGSSSQKAQITISPENSSVYFNLLNPGSTSSQSLGISPGETSVPYGTEGTMDAQIFPSTYYTTCINISGTPPASCSTTAYTPATGTVTFADNGTTVNTAVVNNEGDAEFNAPYSIGTHSVTASYSGDNSYNKSTGSTVAFTVVQDTPNIFVGAANQNTTITTSTVFNGSQTTVFYVLLENSANYQNEQSTGSIQTAPVAPPTGTVTVAGLPSGSSSGTATLVPSVDPSDGLPAGVAQFSIPASACTSSSGCTYNLTITYSGDTNYTALTGANAATGTIGIQPSTQLTSSITASVSGTTITPNQSITVSGTVTGQSGHPAPTGAVYIYTDGSGTTGYALIPGSGDTSTFSGTITSQALVQGGNIITLYYTGDANYASSSVLLNSGNAISTPLSDFSLMPASGSVAVSAKNTNGESASATTTIYITPTNGFSGTVNLSVPSDCGVSGGGLSCTLSASSVSLNYSNTASVTHPDRPWTLLATGGGAVLACVLLFTIPARRRAWRNLLSLIVFACIAGFGIGCGSSGGGTTCQLNCGGGGGGGTPGTATNPSQSVTLTVTASSGVTTGNYMVAVTGTSGSTQVHSVGVMAQVQ